MMKLYSRTTVDIYKVCKNHQLIQRMLKGILLITKSQIKNLCKTVFITYPNKDKMHNLNQTLN